MLILEIAGGVLLAKIAWALLKAINAGVAAFLDAKQAEKDERFRTITNYASSVSEPGNQEHKKK